MKAAEPVWLEPDFGPPPHRRFFQEEARALRDRCDWHGCCRSIRCEHRRHRCGHLATCSAIDAGLRWLARHQNEDGSWSAASFASHCKAEKCGGTGAQDFDVGVTGLAVLAFLEAGIVPANRCTYVDPVTLLTVRPGEVTKKGLQFLIGKQRESGEIGPDIQERMYNHAIATLALTEAYRLTSAVRYRSPAEQAVELIKYAQNRGLGWRYRPLCGNNDTSITGWCVLALSSAQLAGFEVHPFVFDGAKAWILRVTDSNGATGYDKLGSGVDVPPNAGRGDVFPSHPRTTAIGLVVRMLADSKKGDFAMSQAAKIVAADLPKWDAKSRHPTIDAYYWFWGTLALSRYDGPSGPQWKNWQKRLTDTLCDNQQLRKDGCADGSWPTEQADRWAYAGGRVYATAMNVLSLETASGLGSPGCVRAR